MPRRKITPEIADYIYQRARQAQTPEQIQAEIGEKFNETFCLGMICAYSNSPYNEVKRKQKEYYQNPEVKQKLKEYHKEYYQKPEVKQKLKEHMKKYNQKPEVKQRQKEYHEQYYQKPEVKQKRKEYLQKKYFERLESETAAICNQLKLNPELQKKSYEFLKKCIEDGMAKGGRTIKMLYVACIYSTCRQDGYPITINQIADELDIDKFSIYKTYATLVDKYGIKATELKPKDYIPNLVKELGLSKDVEDRACEILGEADKIGLTSTKDPKGWISATVYIASMEFGRKINQEKIAEAAKIDKLTLRSRYKELLKAVYPNLLNSKYHNFA